MSGGFVELSGGFLVSTLVSTCHIFVSLNCRQVRCLIFVSFQISFLSINRRLVRYSCDLLWTCQIFVSITVDLSGINFMSLKCRQVRYIYRTDISKNAVDHLSICQIILWINYQHVLNYD